MMNNFALQASEFNTLRYIRMSQTLSKTLSFSLQSTPDRCYKRMPNGVESINFKRCYPHGALQKGIIVS